MAKFKKLTTKYLCILSSLVICFSAIFLPFEEFKANESISSISVGSYDVSFDFDFADFDVSSANTSLPVDIESSYIDYGTYSETVTTTSFYRLLGTTGVMFSSTHDTYAVRLSFSRVNNYTFNFAQCYNFGFMFGTFSDAESLNGPLINSNHLTSAGNVWYITNYEVSRFYLFLYGYFYSNDYVSSNGSYSDNPSFSCDFDLSCTYQLYSISDLTDEIYAVLQDVYSTDVEVLAELEKIYNSSLSIDSKLNQLVSFAEAQLDYLKEIDANIDELEPLMGVCNSYLQSIDAELKEQTTWLEKIWNTLVEFFDTSDSQQDKVDDFASNSNSQSSDINNLVGDMNGLEKPDAESSVDDIDEFIPDSDSFIISALRNVMKFNVVTNAMLCTVILAFVAYVLFGKR